ncbi:hypothetical protein EVAR_84926_1 [Eumeta japonica]|uniref:Secreted protein n=1 Tax=Eumeta variegata TaxID=151549 RepID=A0A4C1VH58_EUMVA|nr:hypothetical protein EVAR_84926_1 [Eumeta japonica]
MCSLCAAAVSLFYSGASAEEVEGRSLIPRSRSHARLRQNATMSHAFSCVQAAFIDLQEVGNVPILRDRFTGGVAMILKIPCSVTGAQCFIT